MSVSELNTRKTAALAAFDGGDYDEAMRQAEAAQFIVATMANTNRSDGAGSMGLAWNAAAIDQFIRRCQDRLTRAAQSSAGGVRRTNVIYARADS